ncbi:MAG: CPBP family intramembrane metalloprotease [Anaerolineae bacterium]|nr:CPBP family intramembrane metalloprotease [Anaerolineae bacterium]
MSQTYSRISFSTILPALILIGGLDSLYLVGNWWLRAFIEVNAFLWAILMVFFPLLALLQRHISLGELGFRNDLQGAWQFPGLLYLSGAIAGIGWRLCDLLITAQFPQTGTNWNKQTTLIAFLNGLIVIPLVEEVFFRGFLQTGLQERIGHRWAIVVQALLFALHPVHLAQDGFQSALFVLFGLVAGLIYDKTKSIYPLLAAHGVANVLPDLLHLLSEWWWATDWVLGVR